MHRFIVAWAISAIALLSPNWASASDKETAQHIADSLKQSGRLVGFSFGVKYHDGTAWLKGRVSSEEQKALAVELAEQMPEVSQVVDELAVEPVASKPSPVLHAVAKVRQYEPEFDSTHRLAPQQPVVYAAKSPRATSAATLRVSEPTVDPNVRATGGELAFPNSSTVRSTPTQLASAEPAVQPVSAKRSIIRRRMPLSHQPEPAPTPVASNSGPASGPTAAETQFSGTSEPGVAMINGQKVRLIAMVRSPNGGLVPADPALASRLAQNGQNMQLIPLARGQNGALVPATQAPQQSNPKRRGRPLSMGAHRNQAQVRPAAYQGAGPGDMMEPMPGAPLPAHVPSPMAGPAPAYYDQPNMPNYAWPSYAAYPNYAGLTYPRQYSPTAWPYIGPFYPYPQVPLGWRKVTLEWDDGWWFLDFDDKNGH
ncbi:MAG TPA: BON domain-containing protein [Pirellulales bacterium]|nr:BON domain-containing protein [Pirellulales bacterium]